MIELKGEVKLTDVFADPSAKIQTDGTRYRAFGITNGRMSHTISGFRTSEEAYAEREKYIDAGAVPV